MEGNIGGNYIVRFHGKFTGFLFAELNIAFYCVHSVTPTRREEKCRLLLLFPFGLKAATA